MRRLSQGLREMLSQGLEACQEYVKFEKKGLAEVRVGRRQQHLAAEVRQPPAQRVGRFLFRAPGPRFQPNTGQRPDGGDVDTNLVRGEGERPSSRPNDGGHLQHHNGPRQFINSAARRRISDRS